jgi:hypothetical protein
MLLNDYEFRENRRSDSHNLITGANKNFPRIFYIFRSIHQGIKVNISLPKRRYCQMCFSQFTLFSVTKMRNFGEKPQGLTVTVFYIFFANNVDLKIQVFWDVTPCRLVTGCRRFEGTLFVHLQGQAVQKSDPEGESTTIL